MILCNLDIDQTRFCLILAIYKLSLEYYLWDQYELPTTKFILWIIDKYIFKNNNKKWNHLA